jgi:hypothetical protein
VAKGFLAQPFRQSVDLNLGSCYDAEAFCRWEQTTQSSSLPIVNWRIRSTFYSARDNHFRRGQSGVQKRGKQLTTHVAFESCALESAEYPANTLAKLVSLRVASGKRHSHFLERDDPARPKMAAQPSQSCGRIGNIHQNEPANHSIELPFRIERGDFGQIEAHPVLSGCDSAAVCRGDGLCRAFDTQDRSGRANSLGC